MRKLKNNHGFALLIVLGTMAVFIIIAMEFRWSSVLGLKRTSNLKKITCSRNIARAGLAHALAIIQQPSPVWEKYCPYQPKSKERNYLEQGEEDWYTITCQAEDGKLNLNSIPELKEPEEKREVLVELFCHLYGQPEKAEKLADALLTRIDGNQTEFRTSASQARGSSQTASPDMSTSAPLDSLNEVFSLSLSPKTELFSASSSRNTARGPLQSENNLSHSTTGKNPSEKLHKLATVYGEKDPHININAADQELIEIYLGREISEVARQKKRFKDMQELEQELQRTRGKIKESIKSRIKFESNVFRLKVIGGTKDSSFSLQIEAVVHLNKENEVTFLYYSEK